MYWTYLRRELSGRKKQTVIVATGLAIAIALVIVVNALSAGVRDAQTHALQSVYGIGTDLTVAGVQAEPGGPGGGRGGPQFEFGQEGAEQGDDGTTTLSQSRLTTDLTRGTLDASTIDLAAAVDGVTAATGALSLTNTTFSGELPQSPGEGGQAAGPDASAPEPGQQDGGGFGGGSFDIDAFTVLGVDPAASGVGPLTSTEISEGRSLDADDAGASIAMLDAAYAAGAGLAVGDTIDVGGAALEIVGIVSSTSSDADTAANVYIPLDLAQVLSGAGDVVSTVYVQAASADAIGEVQEGLQTALDAAQIEATVSSQSELAQTVSGSLSSASSLISSLGTWLSAIVLAVAVALAVLFTVSGVTRRTRELGTLKAIGWSNGRVVRQVAGESVAQALIGGVGGVVVGLLAVWAVNAIAPTISVTQTADGAGMAGGPGAGMPGGLAQMLLPTSSEIVLTAPLAPIVVVLAVGLSVAGGMMAGALGGLRAARLSPAEALRAVA